MMGRLDRFLGGDRLEGAADALHVRARVVLNAVLLEKGLDARRDLGVVVLRHRREEVVLDLEVEVRHPPVYERCASAVGGVMAE